MGAVEEKNDENFYNWLGDNAKWSSETNFIEVFDCNKIKDRGPGDILIVDGIDLAYCLKSVSENKHNHIVHLNGHEPQKESQLAALMTAEPDKFFSQPLESCLNPSGNELHYQVVYEKEFSKISEKHEMLDQFMKTLLQLNVRESFCDEIRTIADELITNAIYYSGPMVDGERPKELEDDQFAKLQLATDSSRMVIMCTDPNGTLVPQKIIERIEDCHSTPDIEEKINQGLGGAEIGSYMIFKMSSTYIMAVDKDKQTTIGCILAMGMNIRKRDKLPKNLHIIYREDTNE